MTRTEAIALLAFRLGQRTDLDAAILAEMVLTQSVLEQEGDSIPWFLVSEMSSASTVVGEERIATPTDFLGLLEEEPMWVFDAAATPTWSALLKTSYVAMVQRFPLLGKPRCFDLAGDYFLLRPIPDAVYGLRLRYAAADVSVSASAGENNWLRYAPDLLIAETGAVMAGKYLQNPKLRAEFKEDALVARRRLWIKTESRLHNGRTYGMGED